MKRRRKALRRLRSQQNKRASVVFKQIGPMSPMGPVGPICLSPFPNENTAQSNEERAALKNETWLGTRSRERGSLSKDAATSPNEFAGAARPRGTLRMRCKKVVLKSDRSRRAKRPLGITERASASNDVQRADAQGRNRRAGRRRENDADRVFDHESRLKRRPAEASRLRVCRLRHETTRH